MKHEVITEQDIIDLLPIVANQGWSIASGYIRNTKHQCPVCALVEELCGVKYKIWAHAAMKEFGSDFSVCPFVVSGVMDAADFRDSQYRHQLLAALGMKELA